MSKNFKDMKALVVNSLLSNRKMHASIFKLIGFKEVTLAMEASDGYRKFKEESHDIVFADLDKGVSDGLALTQKIRTSYDSPNKDVPVICILGQQAIHLVDQARETGITELIEVPYSVDDIRNRVLYVFDETRQAEADEQIAKPDMEKIHAERSERPSDDEAQKLTNTLLDYYSKNHEILLAKVQFARDATSKSFEDKQNTSDVQDKQAKNLDMIWMNVMQKLASAGISEEDMVKIERIIESVPQDIRVYYDTLMQKDKVYLDREKELDVDAYKAAKQVATEIQSEPNIMTGLSAQDYKTEDIQEEEIKETSVEAVMYDIKKKS